MKINLSKVKGYNFEGYVIDSDLTQDQLDKLDIVVNPDFETEVKVEGSFIVEWDDDIPMVQIDELYLVGAKQIGTGFGPIGLEKIESPDGSMPYYKTKHGPIPLFETIDINPDDVENFDELCSDIEQSGNGCDWLADRYAAMADYYYDSYGDR